MDQNKVNMWLRSIALITLSLLIFKGDTLGQSEISDMVKEVMEYRFLGPYRGGRATTAVGIADQPYTFFMGSTGGGVWRTDDAGNTWENVSDGQIKCGSIGSIAIHPKYTDIMYVGTGSDSPRGNVSAGIGIYKSVDGGKTWNHSGLENSGQLGDIVFHPDNSDIAYAAALGNIFGPNKERGVYKTTDGGKSWTQSLYLSDTTGAIDLAIHPRNPNVIYAGMWRAERKPWTLIDGGKEGGLYKTEDGGDSWEKVENGLPNGLIGKIGVDISPVDPNIIYVIQQTAVEEDGGVYKSMDGGKSFQRINGDHKLRQRGWYYSRIFVDPQDKNTVYVTNTGFYRSIDGGKSFDQRLRVPHGDCHSVWINPRNPDIIINTNDGGATISLNGGKTWSTQNNQPTSELYRISTDDQFPFRVYAGQQDNTTISVPVRNRGGLDPKQHWLEVGGGESADVAVVPSHPHIVYATTYSGIITRVNLQTGEQRYVGAYPHYTEGTEQRNLKYRWQWNFPIRVSIHDEGTIYHTSNYVHKSTDEGSSWEIISPDLTRNIGKYQDIPGGPIQHDGTGVEVYSSIFSFAESHHDPLELWTGSDDGRIHVTRDGGKNWEEVTPKNLIPYEATINHIEVSTHDPKTIFVVAYHYRYNDFRPYIIKSDNGGKSWQLIVSGIDKNHFVRAYAQDGTDPSLMFAGTEYGMYISKDGGKMWEKFQLNLPHTPITDMEIKGDALVMSTQGRGFWILDDISLLRKWKSEMAESDFHLFDIPDTYKSNLGSWNRPPSPPAAPYTVDIPFWTKDTTEKAVVYILDMNQDTLHTVKDIKVKSGMNKISWGMELDPPTLVEDLVMMDMRHPGQGPTIPQGKYTAIVSHGRNEARDAFEIKIDPNWAVSAPDYIAQYELAKSVSDLLDQSQKQIIYLRKVKSQLRTYTSRNDLDSISMEKMKALAKEAKDIQDKIFQDKIKTSQDEINFERKFTNHLIRLYRVVLGQHGAPTKGELERWEDIKNAYLPFDEAFNRYVEKIKVLNSELRMKDYDFLPIEY